MTSSLGDAQSGNSRRFEFGRNWQRFLRVVDETRIADAEKSLCGMLEVKSLAGQTFLDVGCGSGLFSLAARRLGADRIHSFDFDPRSVACARELNRRYFPGDSRWTIEVGSVLDANYLANLPAFDVVYAWGVLHHTGHLWKALEAVVPRVSRGGKLFVAVYNDQGRTSRFWKRVKKFYNAHWTARLAVLSLFVPYFVGRSLAVDALTLKNPLTRYREHRRSRGMSVVYDWLDWLGGYPFEVAKPEEVFDFYRKRGFELVRLKTSGGSLGNNQFVFVRCVD
jgi:SAM-dependent methyltransferase